MPHKPLHQWKLNKDGTPVLDRKGNRVLHPKAGTAKTLKEYSSAERRAYDKAIELDESAKRRSAQQTLAPIEQARKVIGE